jgi:hypothetical protein
MSQPNVLRCLCHVLVLIVLALQNRGTFLDEVDNDLMRRQVCCVQADFWNIIFFNSMLIIHVCVIFTIIFACAWFLFRTI